MKSHRTTLWAISLFALAALVAMPAAADFVINDDLIVDGSACIGFDCVNGESFGFDTIRIKENNLRIKALDTSSASSFPTQDWQITFNDSANGGANKFAIDAISPVSRTMFVIEDDAQSNAIYATSNRVGFGTNTPSVEVHIVDGDTPTLRLEQDGSSGFGPQTWDVAGNETNFFIRDVNNGSTLPFRIRPGAPTSAVDIAGSGNVGVGTSSPDANLHVVETTAGVNNVFLTTNNGSQTWKSEDSSNGKAFFMNWVSSGGFLNDDLNFTMTGFTDDNGAADNNFRFSFNDGNLTIGGDVITAMCPGGCGPDYVFEPDYELMKLDELDAFVQENKHLPNIPSAKDNAKGIRMAEMQLRLLEKVEELTLYTIAQQQTLDELRAANSALMERLAALEQR